MIAVLASLDSQPQSPKQIEGNHWEVLFFDKTKVQVSRVHAVDNQRVNSGGSSVLISQLFFN